MTTSQSFRCRGIAPALTHTVQIAFRQGVQTICLTAKDTYAGRVYERVGYRPMRLSGGGTQPHTAATMRTYGKPET